MRGLIELNCGERFDGDLRGREPCGDEVACLELLKGLGVELCLQLLEDVREL